MGYQLSDIEAERAILCAVLIRPECLSQVRAELSPRNLTQERHRVIYGACLDVIDRGGELDLVTLRSELETAGNLDSAGGKEYLVNLTDAHSTSVGVMSYVNLVKEANIRRRVLEIAGGIQEELKAGAQGEGLDQLLAGTAERLFDLHVKRKTESKEIVPVANRIMDFYDELGQIQQDDRDFTGLDTGFIHLNRVINGLLPGLLVYAGPPGLGKTTLLKQLVDNVAEKEKVPCIFFSWEQSLKELDVKTLSRLASIDNRHILRGKLNQEEGSWKNIHEAVKEYHEFGDMLYIIEGTSRMTVNDIRAMSQGILSRHKADQGLIAIDYLQIIPTVDRFNSTREKVSSITSELRRVSRDLNSPVVAISSEARDKYYKKDLSVFKESGEIEYSADVLGVLTKGGNLHPDLKKSRGVELHIVKNRNGERATIRFTFLPQYSRFKEEDKSDYVEPDEERSIP